MTRSMAVEQLVRSLCPDCAVGRAARALVLSDACWFHLWCAAIPFIVAALIIRVILNRVDHHDAASRRPGRGAR
jgi:hypothetical protein